MTPPGRKPLHGEDGFALIEVFVSALILAIVAAGVLALLSATTRSAAAERNHSQAYALAQEDQARLRSISALVAQSPQIKNINEYTLGGTKFTVESTGVFVNNTKRSKPSQSCSGAETSKQDYVRIHLFVLLTKTPGRFDREFRPRRACIRC